MSSEPLPDTLRRSVIAGVGGTAVMTAFQLLVEMPLTKREESFAPAELAEKLLPFDSKKAATSRPLNYVMHFALGAGWGATRGVMARAGLKGPAAIGGTFAAMYPADVMLATALGVYRPREWSVKDTAIDVVDKLVQAAGTGLLYDRLAR